MYYIKGIDKPGFMSRVKALAGIKRDNISTTSIFIRSRKFSKELEKEINVYKAEFDKGLILSKFLQITNKKKPDIFNSLLYFQEKNGWYKTLSLLSNRSNTNVVLNNILKNRKL